MSPERQNRTGILIDEPSETGKALDFGKYSSVLAQLIKSSSPHFSIGIFGSWGTGKTTLMKCIKEEFKDDPDILPVWFNPWRFEKEEYLAVIPLLRTIKLSIDEYSQKIPSYEQSKMQVLKDGIELALKAFLKSTSLSVGMKGIASADIDFSKILNSLKVEDLPGSETNTIYYHSMEYLQKALEKLLESETNFRIVVFVDDVDRCTPEKGFEVLESIKSFFDMKGFVFVIGMNNKSIDFLVEQKYGKEAKINGLDYLKKIVQLPFQMPQWTGDDISRYLDSILTDELEGTEFKKGFSDRARKLLISSVEPNPRELKRFINDIILAESVFKKDIEPLIAVNALRFRHKWDEFLAFISSNDNIRRNFFDAYLKLNDNEKSLDEFREQIDLYYPEFFNKADSLRQFLNDGGAAILKSIDSMEEYRRALDTTNINKPSLSVMPGRLQTSEFELSASGISIQYSKEEIPKRRPESRRQYYKVKAWIDAPNSVMKEITRVTYRFHPTFRRQFFDKDYVSKTFSDEGFLITFNAYGSFTLGADIEFKDGKSGRINKFLEIASYSSPIIS